MAGLMGGGTTDITTLLATGGTGGGANVLTMLGTPAGASQATAGTHRF